MNTNKNIPKQRGFIVPDNYFNDSREKITTRLKFQDLASELSTQAYGVPDGYFEDSKKELLRTLSRKHTEDTTSIASETKVIPLTRYLYPIAGIAATLLLLVSILWAQYNFGSTEVIESTAIVAYFDDTATDLESIDFADLLTDEDIEALQDDIALEEADIIDYLEDRTDSYDFYIK